MKRKTLQSRREIMNSLETTRMGIGRMLEQATATAKQRDYFNTIQFMKAAKQMIDDEIGYELDLQLMNTDGEE